MIVEAIESFFVPVAIYNNKGGKDAEALKYFKEPSWNNPVVRIVDHNKKNISDRLAGNYSTKGLVHTMMTAMSQTGQIIPEYLNILAQELSAIPEVFYYDLFLFSSFRFYALGSSIYQSNQIALGIQYQDHYVLHVLFLVWKSTFW